MKTSSAESTLTGLSQQTSEFAGYRGTSLKILEKAGAKIGTKVRVKTVDSFEMSGLVVPRYEHADSNHIVLKLKSGYNIGIKSDRIESIVVLEESVQSSASFGRSSGSVETPAKGDEASQIGKKRVLLLSTGGTIASRVDYRTGAVYPALSAEDLYSAVPELGEIASIEPKVVFSTYSENLTPTHWQKLSEYIVSRIGEHTSLQDETRKVDGIVVMLGTDTLAYVSAALSFSLIGLQVPVVCVGAQRSSDRPSSDAALNLKAAVRFAVNSQLPGVYISMHKSENDDIIAIHSGVRVRKNHTSRRDAFQSISAPHVALVEGEKITVLPVGEEKRKGTVSPSENVRLKTKFEPKVALLKFHPGFEERMLGFFVKDLGVKGIIFEGTGLGHVSSNLISRISEIVKNEVFVGMTSQCIRGHVDLDVYETGRDLLSAGVTPLENTLGETAFAKLSWVLGNFDSSETRKLMLSNLVGEFTERIPLHDQ